MGRAPTHSQRKHRLVQEAGVGLRRVEPTQTLAARRWHTTCWTKISSRMQERHSLHTSRGRVELEPHQEAQAECRLASNADAQQFYSAALTAAFPPAASSAAGSFWLRF